MLKLVQHDIQLLVTLNCLGFPSQKQVVRFTTLALTFVFATSGLRYRFALRQSARFRVFVANEFSEKLIISFALLTIIGRVLTQQLKTPTPEESISNQREIVLILRVEYIEKAEVKL